MREEGRTHLANFRGNPARRSPSVVTFNDRLVDIKFFAFRGDPSRKIAVIEWHIACDWRCNFRMKNLDGGGSGSKERIATQIRHCHLRPHFVTLCDSEAKGQEIKL